MIVTNSFSGYKGKLGALALGMFDGVHLGHAAILDKAVNVSRAKKLLSAAMTFRPHPMEYFGKEVPLLSGPEHSRKLLHDRGIDVIIEHPFTSVVSEMSPNEFVEYLAEMLSPLDLIAGFNYSFGRRGRGELSDLKRLGEGFGIYVHGVGPVLLDGNVVSSTRIRGMIELGLLDDAKRLLGHGFTLEGVVVHGDGRGSKLGFPTANIRFGYRPVLPPFGVYLVRSAQIGFGVANLGLRPTFLLDKPQLEIFFLNQPTESLYDKSLEVELIQYIRPEMSFSSADQLVSRVAEDIAAARQLISRFS